MSRIRFSPDPLPWFGTHQVAVLSLTTANLFFNIVAGASFKLSAASPTWRGFLIWQVVGNLAGFITVLALTGMLRYIPLSVAYPITTGLAVLGVQVAAASMLFHESINSAQWLGTLLVVVGIMLVGGR